MDHITFWNDKLLLIYLIAIMLTSPCNEHLGKPPLYKRKSVVYLFF